MLVPVPVPVPVPVIGAAAGAAGGAGPQMRDGLGTTDEQLDRIRGEVTLFLVTEQADLDRLGERMRGVFTRLVDTNLTDAERSMLTDAMGSLRLRSGRVPRPRLRGPSPLTSDAPATHAGTETRKEVRR